MRTSLCGASRPVGARGIAHHLVVALGEAPTVPPARQTTDLFSSETEERCNGVVLIVDEASPVVG